MDRGNRRIVVAPILLAFTLLVVLDLPGLSPRSESQAATGSGVVQADLQDQGDPQPIQQVAGTRPSPTKKRSLNLLQALVGDGASEPEKKPAPRRVQRSATSNTAPQANRPQSTGLLSGLFGDSNESPSSSKLRSARQPNHASREAASWDGVPYHTGHRPSSAAQPAPIRDPSPASRAVSSRAGGQRSDFDARIVRGQSARAITAPSQSPVASSTRRAVPAPAAVEATSEMGAARSAPGSRFAAAADSPSSRRSPTPLSTSLSATSSSRRTDRHTVDALDTAEIGAAAKPQEREIDSNQSTDPMGVPRVARRALPTSPVAQNETTASSTLGVPRLPSTPNAELARSAEPAAGDSVTGDANVEAEPAGSLAAVPYAASSPDPSVSENSSDETSGTTATGEFQARPSLAVDSPPRAPAATPYRTASSTPRNAFVPSGDIASYRLKERGSEPAADSQSSGAQSASLPSQATETDPAAQPTEQSESELLVDGRRQSLPPLVASTDGDNAAPTSTPPSLETPQGFTARSAELSRAAVAAGKVDAGQSQVASELPGIRVVTYGPSAIMIRQSHPYEIRIENRGAIDASGVIVRASIPDWAEVQGSSASRGGVESDAQSGSTERLVWKIDQLPAGTTERMFVRLKAVRSGSHGMDVDWNLAPQKSVSKVYVQEPKIAVSIDGPDEVIYGESKTYKVRIANPGDGVAANVMFTLSPNSATPQTQRIGDIPAGKEAQIEVELTAQDLGDLKINGLAAGDLELRAEATKTIRVAAAKLQATLSGPQLKYQNTESTYHLQIQNAGTATSAQIVATLRLPVGVKYLGGLETATQQADLLTWELDALAPGAVRDYQFRCDMTATGDHLLAFDCRGTAAGQAEVAISTRVEAIADLKLTVNDPPAPAPIDSEVTYEITVHNRGSKQANDVRAVAQFSHGIEPLRIEGQTGQVSPGQVLFDPIAQIGPGEEIVLRVIAKADSAGHHRFRTEVRAGDTVLVAEEATHYMSTQSDRVSRRSDEVAPH